MIYQYDELREKHNTKPYDYETIICQVDSPIGRIILNQPERRNPLGYKRLYEIAEAAKEMEMDEDVKVIILKGAGACFSAGYDMTPIPPGEPRRNTPPSGVYIHPDRDQIWRSYGREHLRVYYTLWDLQKPVIAQIHSFCLAGASELASFCDIRFVADNATIGFPVVTTIGPGSIQYMPWMVGITKAKEYMFTGDPMDAQEAWRVGWATKVYPVDKLEEETERFARRVAKVETALIMLTKRSINRQLELMGFKVGIDWSMDYSTLSGFRKGGGEWGQAVREKGLKGALEERESTFRDRRTSEAAKKTRKKETK